MRNSWALPPDGTVLTVECFNSPKAEKFVPAADAWLSAGQTPSTLVEAASNEIGPAVVLTDGRCFFVGATGKTALYSAPPVASDVGRWVNGPDFPNTDKTQLGAKDAPACLLPNGRVLCTVGPVDGKEESYLTPTSFFEVDGQQLNRVPDPPNNGGAPFDGRLLIIPSGQALYWPVRLRFMRIRRTPVRKTHGVHPSSIARIRLARDRFSPSADVS